MATKQARGRGGAETAGRAAAGLAAAAFLALGAAASAETRAPSADAARGSADVSARGGALSAREAARSAGLVGRYRGPSGALLTVRAARGGYDVVVSVGSSGVSFFARGDDRSALGRAETPRGPAVVRLEAHASVADAAIADDGRGAPVEAVSLSWIPLDAEETPIAASARITLFVRARGAADDPAGEGGVEAARHSAVAFLETYRSNAPAEVAEAYAGLSPAARAIVALFARLQTDVAWHMCGAPLGRALVAGAGAPCSDLRAALAAVERRGGLALFLGDAAEERDRALGALKCATGALPSADCVTLSAEISSAILEGERPIDVLNRY